MPRKLTLDLSSIADRVYPQTWSLFQTLRTRMRQMKGVTMKLDYEKHTLESVPSFYYGNRQLFQLKARGEEINATIHADENHQNRIVQNEGLDPMIRDQIKQSNWTDFTIKSSKDLVPFMELVKVKYALIAEDLSAPKPLEEPTAIAL
jgi:hypothetical protein